MSDGDVAQDSNVTATALSFRPSTIGVRPRIARGVDRVIGEQQHRARAPDLAVHVSQAARSASCWLIRLATTSVWLNSLPFISLK